MRQCERRCLSPEDRDLLRAVGNKQRERNLRTHLLVSDATKCTGLYGGCSSRSDSKNGCRVWNRNTFVALLVSQGVLERSHFVFSVSNVASTLTLTVCGYFRSC